MRRFEVKDVQKQINEYFHKGGGEIPNGNTPSPLSPTNSVGSQVSVRFVFFFFFLLILILIHFFHSFLSQIFFFHFVEMSAIDGVLVLL